MCSSVAPVNSEIFINRAKCIHGEKYEYESINFISMNKKVAVRCRVHGDFLTLPKDHIAKMSGCPQCAIEAGSSEGEKEVARWLEGKGFEIIRNDRLELDGFEIDIYIPSKKLGIEFNGAYWHQDGKLAHPRIHETKATRAEHRGIQIMTVWDFDWKHRKEMIMAMILHRLGRGASEKIHARSCVVQKVSAEQASEFYLATHIQGRAWRSIVSYGLFYNSELVACMSFSQGSSRRGKSGNSEWELTRFSTAKTVRGGASKLFKAFRQDFSPEIVWSFSDRQHFNGGLYEALKFIKDGRVAADYRVYHPQTGQIWHKSAWQRRHIPARLRELGIDETFSPEDDPRTEREMQMRAKVLRIMDSGKIRWRWLA